MNGNCLHGHPWSENLVIRQSGKRYCRECDRNRSKRNHERKAQAVIAAGTTCACGCGAAVRVRYVTGHQNTSRAIPAIDRLMAKVQINEASGCWEWIAGMKGDGYGAFGKTRSHRAAYELLKGPVPEGLELDHTCRNRKCCNPVHLEPVTHRVNVLRGEGIAAKRAKQTHCVNGHEFNEPNTYLYGIYRFCKTCRRDKGTRWQRKKRAQQQEAVPTE